MTLIPRHFGRIPRKTKRVAHARLNGRRTRRANQRMRRLRRWLAHVVPAPLPKAKWGPGPWQDEPDLVQFTHAGLSCVIARHMAVTGSLCGYVLLSPTHPWWGKDCYECTATPQCAPADTPDWDLMAALGAPVPHGRLRRLLEEDRWHCPHTPANLLTVHGGVTRSDVIGWTGSETSRAWRAAGWAERPTWAPAWGFGFDCSHAGDLTPLSDATLARTGPQGAALVRRRRAGGLRETYWTLPYVRHQVEQLAEQLALVAHVATV